MILNVNLKWLMLIDYQIPTQLSQFNLLSNLPLSYWVLLLHFIYRKVLYILKLLQIVYSIHWFCLFTLSFLGNDCFWTVHIHMCMCIIFLNVIFCKACISGMNNCKNGKIWSNLINWVYGNPLQYPPWKISWTEEPGGLQSMGSQRVRHDWATNITL